MSENLSAGDRVVMIRRKFSSGKIDNQLVYDTSTPDAYWVNYNSTGFVPAFSPASREEILYVYGVAASGDLGMPFNRADYFIAVPGSASSLPTTCAPGTGILYKATVNHTSGNPGGKLNYSTPLLDCVADMQVVIGWDLWDATNNVMGQDGIIDTWSSVLNDKGNLTHHTDAPHTEVNSDVVKAAFGSAETIRNAMKVIKVYILAQNGRKDPNYQGPSSMAMGESGELSLTRTYDLSSLRNYRWKLYRIVVRPKNLIANQ